MSEKSRRKNEQRDTSGDEPSKGPSLAFMYSLIALALAAALVIAALIVRPFYLHR